MKLVQYFKPGTLITDPVVCDTENADVGYTVKSCIMFYTDPGRAAEIRQDPGEEQGTVTSSGERHVSWRAKPHEYHTDVPQHGAASA